VRSSQSNQVLQQRIAVTIRTGAANTVGAAIRILTYSGYSLRGMSERIARQFIKALRQAGVTHRLEYEPDENQIGFYDASGSRVRVSFLGDAATALADARANVYSLPFAVNETQSARYVFNDDSYQAARLVNPRMFDGLPVT
jgi:hypothetical protein